MFGRPKAADAKMMLDEVRLTLSAMAAGVEAEHPDPSPTDAQALVTWSFVAVTHAIGKWGRARPDAFVAVYRELGLSASQRPRADMWPEAVQNAEAERIRALLEHHTGPANYEGMNAAAADYHPGLAAITPGPALSAEQFVRVQASAMAASLTRLQDAGYIRAG